MPLGSILTVPFETNNENRENVCHQCLIESDSKISPSDDSALTKGRIIQVKCLQLVVTIVITMMFIYEKSMNESINFVDLLISGFLGGLLMYPIFVFGIPEYSKLSMTMLVLNLICCLMHFANGIFSFSSWYELENRLIADEIEHSSRTMNIEKLKYFAAIFSFIIGTVYLSEVFLQVMDAVKKLSNY